MNLRSTLGVLAAVLGLIGLACGVLEWFLQIFVLPEIDWAEPLMSVATLCWIGHACCFGGALILVGIAVALPAKASATETVAPPPPPRIQPKPQASPPQLPPFPTPKQVPVKPVRVEETRADEDLWQSADAPFPTPPNIDRPSAGPSLWQSDQAPFPKMDIPEDEENDDSSRRGS